MRRPPGAGAGARVRGILLLGLRGHAGADAVDDGLRVIDTRRPDEHAEEWQRVDDDQRSDELGMLGGEVEGQRTAEAVADDDRPGQPARLDVAHELRLHLGKERRLDRWNAREAGEREHLTPVPRSQVIDGRLPGFARGGEAGDEENRWAGAGHLDPKRLRRRRDCGRGWRLGRGAARAANDEGDDEAQDS
jgi:hypothetical protein